MAKYRIAWLPGDGIGNDVMEAARLVLDKLGLDAEYVPGDIGWEFWRTEGNPLPDRTLEMLRTTKCALFGAITSKPKEEAAQELDPSLRDKGLVYRSPIVRLRQEFNLHTNLRPCKAFKGNPLNYRDDIDLVVFRENTEGLYSGVEFHPVPEEVRAVLSKHSPRMKAFDRAASEDLAISCRIFTRKGCENIARQAFEYAKKFGRKTVTVVEKPNVIRETSGLMVRSARKVAKEYPGIELWETNVDAMCMWLVKNPQDYDVLVATNMFGDIISDLCAQLVGGLGFACSGNIGDDYGVFEPTHGSAPKYAGQYKVNPIAMLLTTKMMLDYLGEMEMADKLYNAVAGVLEEKKVATYDMGGSHGTLDMAKAVAALIGEGARPLGMTVIEKIIGAHTRDPVAPGQIVWMDLDIRSARDFGGANVVKNLEREYGADAPVDDVSRTFFTFDCNAPANTIPYANNQQVCRIFARKRGIRVHDVDAGIGSHVVLEQGLCLPGTTVVGTDSHMNILGAVGAFGQGMGDADIAYGFRWGRTWFEVPPTMRVKLLGKPGPYAKPKDITLAVLSVLGSRGGLGRAIEFTGPVVERLSLSGRITLSSMATEMGAIIGLIHPNQEVMDFCTDRSGGASFQAFEADPDAVYADEVEIELDGLTPLAAKPGSPSDVLEVAKVAGREVDSAFIGSCTNGRIEDFRDAARVLKGRQVKDGFMLRLGPATKEVYGQIVKEGLVQVFYEAGAILSHQGCGGCASGQLGMTGKGEVQVSTSNRNFIGKQGDGETYLVSPSTAAATAVAGHLTSEADL